MEEMKTIGLIGGMSWESTAGYYRAINTAVKQRLGGFHSARIVMHSVDFDPIEKLQAAGDWEGAGQILSDAGRSVEAGGADFLLICTNTMHKVAGQVAAAVGIPLLHIADATAEVLLQAGIGKIGLLGTAYTMEQAFYKGRLAEQYGLEVVVPEASDRQLVHEIIFTELCQGIIRPESQQKYIDIVAKLFSEGAQGVILGCTEIGMLIKPGDTPVPLYDTTQIHAERAVDWALISSGGASE